MPEKLNKPKKTIDEYIAGYPLAVQQKLQKIRGIIRKAAPNAIETISYGIPTFVQHGNLVHFVGYKTHIGFYPAPDVIEAFKKELTKYQFDKIKKCVEANENKPIKCGRKNESYVSIEI